MFQTKVLEKIKTHFVFSNFLNTPPPRPLIRKSWLSWDNVEKYVRAGQVKDENITLRMRIEWWIPKATNAYSEYVIFIVFPRQKLVNENAKCYVVSTSSMLSFVVTVRGDADKSLARPRRKGATATELGIYSTYKPWSSIHLLASCSNFCEPLEKYQKVFRHIVSKTSHFDSRTYERYDAICL